MNPIIEAMARAHSDAIAISKNLDPTIWWGSSPDEQKKAAMSYMQAAFAALLKHVNQTAFDDFLEVSYWRFDARRKGYGEWMNLPMSERDAFKAEMRVLIAALGKQE